jgi:hypothetical protein
MLSASVCAVALGACTQDRSSNTPGVPEGNDTSLELSMQFRTNANTEAEQTRATADPNATEPEASVRTVDVFIYTGAGDYLSHVNLQASAFTQVTPATAPNADTWRTSTPIATTTGNKNFLVGVNLPSAAASSLENQTLTAATTVVQTIARTAIANATNGLPMFSLSPVAATMQLDATQNRVTLPVKRIVAKVTVERDPAMTQGGTTGALGQLTWAINNQNSKYFLQQGSPSAYADPNWTAASYLAADFSAATAPGDYVAVNNGPQSPVSNYNALYALENTSEQKTTKELTRVTVRATFVPAQWVTTYTSGSGTVTHEANPNSTPVTFYAVTPAVGQSVEYFQNLADATAFATDKGTTVNTYTDGLCYWNIFMNKAGRGDVIRNDYYKCNITRIVAPGQPTDELTLPNSPVATDTSITVDVDMLFWNTPVQDSYELVP